MDRPYDLDTNGLVHRENAEDCPLREEANGDANRDGVITGIVEHGEVPCPSCIGDDAKLTLMEAAIQRKNLL